MNLISLENFDQYSQREPILTGFVAFYFVPNSSPSPRYIEACHRQGIHPKELIVRSIDEIKALYKEKDRDKATMEQRARIQDEKWPKSGKKIKKSFHLKRSEKGSGKRKL